MITQLKMRNNKEVSTTEISIGKNIDLKVRFNEIGDIEIDIETPGGMDVKFTPREYQIQNVQEQK